MTADSVPSMEATKSEGSNGDQPPGKIKNLVGSWEQRATATNGVPDVARMAASPSGGISKNNMMFKTVVSSQDAKKNTRQAMEDLSFFASPREIKKKFEVPGKSKNKLSSTTPEGSMSANYEARGGSSSEATKEAIVHSPPSPSESTEVKDESPKIGSIRDRMKAFEQNNDGDGGPPWMTQGPRGKRGSALDKFTPKRTAKDNVRGNRSSEGVNDKELPRVNLHQDDSIGEEEEKQSFSDPKEEVSEVEDRVEEEKDDENKESNEMEISLKDAKASIASVDEEEGPELDTDTPKRTSAKIDRDTLVLEEIRKMIRETEDNEMEDEMDEEIKEYLEKAALQSPAYTRRWYDALSDSWIHCPSLATIIMDFTLIEAAEELYGEELPMLYSVSLRAVASDVLNGEEELPEYVYRLAS